MTLTVTLCTAAAAAILNIWLALRIGKVRMSTKIEVGDGGDEALIRRMRAQANFIENAPLTLILIGVVEASGRGGRWLAIVAALFIIGRVAHGIGMDGGFKAGRPIGTLTALLAQLGLAVVAVLIALGKM